MSVIWIRPYFLKGFIFAIEQESTAMNKLLLTLAAIVAFGFTACAQKKDNQSMETRKTLVAYFSATGTTARAAKALAEVSGGTLHEIVPEKAYTSADLDWHDQQSRSSVEMNDPKSRPALKASGTDLSAYEVVFIGYPIWWDQAPRVINTFIESHDLKGKTLVPFATSGSSGIGNSVVKLKQSYPDLNWKDGKLLNRADRATLQQWVESLK